MITIRAFAFDDCGEVVAHWYEQQAHNPQARARLDARMIHLRQQPREGWVRDFYDILRDAEGVGEVRFKARRIHHRGLGYFGPARNEFTFLLFATKADHWEPRNAIDQAVERKRMVEADPDRAVKLKRWGQQ